MEPNNQPLPASVPGNSGLFPSATELLSWSIKIYQSKLSIITKLSLPLALIGIIQLIAGYLGVDSDSEVAITVFDLLYALVFILVYPSLIKTIQSDQTTSFKEAITNGSKYTVSFVMVTLLTILTLLGAFSLLIVPGIILSVYLTFAGMIVVTENKKGTEALQRSWFYADGYWWSIAWRLIFLTAISFLIGMMSGFIIAFGTANSLIEIITGSIIILLTDLVITPISVIYLYGMYQNLKQIKEATGLLETPNKRRLIIHGMAILSLLVIVTLLTLATFTYL